MDKCFRIWNLFQNSSNEIRTKALLIGINYLDRLSKYRSIRNIGNILKMKEFITTRKYFLPDDITTMTDDLDYDDKLYPTTKNIIAKLNDLLIFANDCPDKNKIFIVYSGHTVGITGSEDEKPSTTQALVTTDGIVSRYDFHDNFINKLSELTTVFVIVDSYNIQPFCELKYRHNYENGYTYTVVDTSIPTDCTCIILNACKYNDYLLNLLNDENIGEYNNNALIDAFLGIYNENISVRNLTYGIKQWFQKNNLKQVPHISSSSLIYINRVVIGSLFKTDNK
ncbi:MAG: caspase domain protein [Satyrvirus sp.]|uniref:Caspase domain protein n=1 Tax=Satyrvirus sp. TaxID=2487771 RepID=A0A3G5AF71_9VIRU|nr:MAG: caspase domain protein [Satyrvirus sp.]